LGARKTDLFENKSPPGDQSNILEGGEKKICFR